MFDDPKKVVVGSAVIGADGKFRTSVVLPHAQPGHDKLQVVAKSPSGGTTSLAAPVMVLADVSRPVGTGNGNRDVTETVLITVSIAIPLLTWLVLQMLASRKRRLGGRNP